jgi:hypothetical protein
MRHVFSDPNSVVTMQPSTTSTACHVWLWPNRNAEWRYWLDELLCGVAWQRAGSGDRRRSLAYIPAARLLATRAASVTAAGLPDSVSAMAARRSHSSMAFPTLSVRGSGPVRPAKFSW